MKSDIANKLRAAHDALRIARSLDSWSNVKVLRELASEALAEFPDPDAVGECVEALQRALPIVTFAVHEHAQGPLGPSQRTDPGWEDVGDTMEQMEAALAKLEKP